MSPEIIFSYALSQSMARQPKPACETLWYHRLLDHHHNFKMALISSFFSVLCNLLCFDRIGGLLGFGYTVDFHAVPIRTHSCRLCQPPKLRIFISSRSPNIQFQACWHILSCQLLGFFLLGLLILLICSPIFLLGSLYTCTST